MGAFTFIGPIRGAIKFPFSQRVGGITSIDNLQPVIWLVKRHESGIVAHILLARYASYHYKNA